MKRPPETPLNITHIDCDFCMNPIQPDKAVKDASGNVFCDNRCKTDFEVMTELQKDAK